MSLAAPLAQGDFKFPDFRMPASRTPSAGNPQRTLKWHPSLPDFSS